MTTRLERFDPTRLRALAIAGVLMGLLAGLVGATFASIAGEPAIDEAIAIEEANAAADPEPTVAEHAEEASVSRADQRGFGLFAGYALTGAAFGALLALTAHALGARGGGPVRRVLVAGAILAGGFTVAPWLKYPPNPPAVGDPATLGERQGLYVLTIMLCILVGIAAAALSGRLRSAGWPDHRCLPVVVAAVAVPMLVAYAVLPPAPDDVAVPATLVWRFRLASLGANLSLWAVLTLGVSWAAGEAVRRRTVSPTGTPAATA